MAFNYFWEMAQMPFFRDMRFSDPWTWARCFQAGLGDGVMILLIALGGRAIFRSWSGALKSGGLQALYAVAAGLLLAASVEVAALAAGRWAYSGLMPVVPPFGLGVVPLVQMVAMPPVILYLAARASGLLEPLAGH